MPVVTMNAYIDRSGNVRKAACSYYDAGTTVCTASCSSMLVDDRTKAKYCANEDYDDCPIFLVKRIVKKR